jgi:hypothetical protein
MCFMKKSSGEKSRGTVPLKWPGQREVTLAWEWAGEGKVRGRWDRSA